MGQLDLHLIQDSLGIHKTAPKCPISINSAVIAELIHEPNTRTHRQTQRPHYMQYLYIYALHAVNSTYKWSHASHYHRSSTWLTFRVFNSCWIFADTFPCGLTTTYRTLNVAVLQRSSYQAKDKCSKRSEKQNSTASTSTAQHKCFCDHDSSWHVAY